MAFHGCPIEPSDWTHGNGEPEGDECRTCDGTGEVTGDDELEHTCPSCDGSGYVPYEPDFYLD